MWIFRRLRASPRCQLVPSKDTLQLAPFHTTGIRGQAWRGKRPSGANLIATSCQEILHAHDAVCHVRAYR